MNISYIKEISQLDWRCRQFLFLYFIRAISAGMAFFIGIYLAHIHMKWLLIGYEVSSLSAGYLVGAWLAAQLSDRINPILSAGISLFIQGVCFLLIAHANIPWLLGSAVFIYGVTGYFYIAVNHYVITSYAKDSAQDRAQIISLSSVASNLGLLLGGILVSYLTKENAPTIFSVVGGTLIAASCLYFIYRKDSLKIKEVNQEDNSATANQLIYVTALIVTFLMGLIFAQQRVGYQIFLETYYNSNQISLVLFMNTALIVLFLPALTRQIMKFNPINMMGFGGFILGIGMYLSILSNAYFLTLALCLIRTIGEMIITVLSQYLCFQYAPKSARGKAMGHHKLIFALGVLCGSFTSGNLMAKFGVNIVWELCGLLGLVILIICVLINYRSKDYFLHISNA